MEMDGALYGRNLRALLAQMDETRPSDCDAAPGMPGNDAAELLRETRHLLKALGLWVLRSGAV